MQTFAVVLFRAIVLALAIGLCGQQSAQAAKLRDAATINSTNASDVRFDQVYRITPHNTYNPNDWHSLTEALDQGVRTIELDVYNSTEAPTTPKLCAAYGGTWHTIPPDTWAGCKGYNPTALREALRESLVQAINGQPVTAHPIHSAVGLQVKHDPVGEDPIISDLALIAMLTFPHQFSIPIVAARVAKADDFYGNNCSGGDVTTVGKMKTELARCLQTIRAWMDAHPGHTPITLLFDIKENMHLDAALAFDLTLRAVFGHKLYTPTELRTHEGTKYDSPRDRVMAKGWPKMSDLSGKVLAIYARGETFQVKGHTEPNDTLRYYLNGIADVYLDPAAFVCPLVNSGSDVDAPYSFGRGSRITPADYPRLMGQVVCNNIYTGQKTGWFLDTAAVPMQDAMAAVDAARQLKLLTYVWSFDDPLAGFPEVAHEFVRRGVNMFSIERGGLQTPTPHPYTQHILPWEGLAGITNYSFILRQKNNPYFVLTAGDASVSLKSYDGSKSQQWAISRTGRLFSLANKSKCLTFDGPHKSDGAFKEQHRFTRPEALDNDDDNWVHNVPVWNKPAADMRPCRGADVFQSFTLYKDRSSTTGVLILLNPRQLNVTGLKLPVGGLHFLTPTAYNESARLVADSRNFESINCGNPKATQRRRPVPVYGPSTTPYPNALNLDDPTCVPLQEFEIDFHLSAAAVVDPALGTQPKKEVIRVPDEGPGSQVPPKTWRDYLPFNESNWQAIHNNKLIPAAELSVWTYGYNAEKSYPGAIANGTLPFTALLPNDPSIELQRAASELLSAAEYAKWQSTARTLISDLPPDTSLDAVAKHFFGAWAFMNDGGDMPPCYPPYLKYCQWWSKANTANTNHPQPYQYWELPNKPYLWYMAQKSLPPAEYVKWQQRLKFKPQEFYVHNEAQHVYEQLLEGHGNADWYWGPGFQFADALGTRYQDELLYHYAVVSNCFNDGPPEQSCGSQVSPAPDHRYHWNLIPFDADHRVMAEAAFNSPNPAYAHTKQPEDWALWSAAAAIREAVGHNKITWRDVPLGANYHTIVTGSKLLDEVEKAKYLEKERLEKEFVSQGKTIAHLDVDPDELKREVATQYLSAAELALWNERALVALKDVPLNSTLLANGTAAKLLSARELADFTAQIQAAGHVDAPLPEAWPDVPPARGKRFAAQYLLPASKYQHWIEAELGTELDFPQVFTNKTVEDLAARTMSIDEFTAWKKIIGPNPPQVTSHNWLMIPRRVFAHKIAIRLLSSAEVTTWVEMTNSTILPQHLGSSIAAYNYAKSALSAEDFATWRDSAQKIPLTWQAFRFDRSLMQQRIVEAIFGANSPDYIAWMQAGGPE